MWATVLVIAIIAALDPFRLGTAFLLISQRRPVHSLFAYWIGAMVAAVVSAVALLTLLRHLTPRLSEHVIAITGSSAAGYVKIGLGLVALPLAVLVITGVFPRRRELEMAGGPATIFQAPAPGPLARLSSGTEHRHNRAFWIAFAAGVVSAAPPVEYLVVLAVILGSGAAMGTQFSAAVIFIVVALAAIEIPLISCMLNPERGEALMLRLHEWLRVHSRQILALALAIGGVLLVTTGVGAT